MARPRSEPAAPGVWRAVLLGLALLALASGCNSSAEEGASRKPKSKTDARHVTLTPEEVERGEIVVHPVSKGEFRVHRDFPATVVPNHHAMAQITALVRGRVIDVYADYGQQVKAGEPLALLYSGDLGMAQAAYLSSGAKLYVAEKAFERAKVLLKEKVIGLAELQRREGQMLSMQAERREAQNRLRLLGMTDEQIDQLDRDHKIRSYVPITAPFDSRVIQRNITKGEVVEVTEKLFTVADLSEVWVLANIPEKDIPFIRASERQDGEHVVEVRVNAYPDEVFHGTVTYVGDVLDVATRTMNLRVEVPNPDRKLKPEMYATVRVYSPVERDVLTVPETAIQRDRERQYVFVRRDDQTFEARDIRIGVSNGDVVTVLDGLRQGEQVVTNGGFILKSELLGEQL
ncbi:MAG TPA: efflux RND transporter periplasmic adaptor subunit [Nitrospira sp.]|nr:efflux RND transporter periplasmic adaptor subunit [Nitrospira sp.]